MDRHILAEQITEAGLVPVRTIELPETDRHIASVIVIARHDGDGPGRLESRS